LVSNEVAIEVYGGKAAVFCLSQTQKLVLSIFRAVVLNKSVLRLDCSINGNTPNLNRIVSGAGSNVGAIEPSNIVDTHLMCSISLAEDCLGGDIVHDHRLVRRHSNELGVIWAHFELVGEVRVNYSCAFTLTLEWETLVDEDFVAFTASEEGTLLVDQGKVRAKLSARKTEDRAAFAAGVSSNCVSLDVCSCANSCNTRAVMRPDDLVNLPGNEGVILLLANGAVLFERNYRNDAFLVSECKLACGLLLGNASDLGAVVSVDFAIKWILGVSEDQVILDCVHEQVGSLFAEEHVHSATSLNLGVSHNHTFKAKRLA